MTNVFRAGSAEGVSVFAPRQQHGVRLRLGIVGHHQRALRSDLHQPRLSEYVEFVVYKFNAGCMGVSYGRHDDNISCDKLDSLIGRKYAGLGQRVILGVGERPALWPADFGMPEEYLSADQFEIFILSKYARVAHSEVFVRVEQSQPGVVEAGDRPRQPWARMR
jgi:hypothetical protein